MYFLAKDNKTKDPYLARNFELLTTVLTCLYSYKENEFWIAFVITFAN